MSETVNKDMQTAGGTKGFSLKPSSVQKHYMMSEFRTSFLGKLGICTIQLVRTLFIMT